ncbi:putative transcriptional regulator [Geoglobus ahangari]|uniref:Putative transcriptional regulator n=1 Tax=Geoglobus ahangari TaxID=113653 RepID=A0A0F7IGF4_9EURY|nr:helix-turn-helix domain-containing protein [Geoglobus ahangari]AKG91917.1 putative transcriptional regulator [Geoglobus ahangari]NOY10908.1 helix-turn-helix domain-containing protein [Archaeoglobi archaeon]
MKSPCEVIASKVIPVIRGEIARELVARGHSKKEVAEILGITVAAVSQYTHGKRGVSDNQLLKEKVKEVVDEIESGKLKDDDLVAKLCELCSFVRRELDVKQI